VLQVGFPTLRMRLLLLSLCILAAAQAHLEPSRVAIEQYAKDLESVFPKVDAATLRKVAELQLEYIVNHRNDTNHEMMKQPLPMLSDCPELKPTPTATHIKQLKPQDIRVVAAVGDSISTGCNSLSTTWFGLKDYQGLSWSIGEDSGVNTLPNLLKQYTTSLVGGAKGTGDGNTGFNFAKNGAVVQDVPAQVDNLIAAMKSNTAVNYEEDWKVITVLIGGNNLCEVCKDEKANDAAVYEQYLKESLDKLSTVPRAFVNLVPGLEYTQIAKYKGPLCALMLPFVCDCITSTDSSKQDAVRKANTAYNEVISRLAATYGRDDFAVVVQPSLVKSVIPDKSYISTADCFHPSGDGQRMLAVGLWNSMLLPVQDKGNYVATVDDVPSCADENTLLYS